MPHTNEDTEKEIENEEAQTEDLQPNLQTGSITVQKDGHFIHCLTVIGQIEGHYILPSQNKTTKYEHVIPQLVAIEESDDDRGPADHCSTRWAGDVEAGLAIAELIVRHAKTPTASLVLGGGHSIGVPLARVRPGAALLCPAPSMTVHPVRMSGTGHWACRRPCPISRRCRIGSCALLLAYMPRSAQTISAALMMKTGRTGDGCRHGAGRCRCCGLRAY